MLLKIWGFPCDTLLTLLNLSTLSSNDRIDVHEYVITFCFWFFFSSELKEVTAESSRGGVDIKRIYGEWTTSYLLIRNANIADSGIYTCAPAGGSQTNIKVHVFLHGKSNCQTDGIFDPKLQSNVM